jgi:hypothetical protein
VSEPPRAVVDTNVLIAAVCQQYALNADQLEDRAARSFLTAPAGGDLMPQGG